MTLVPIEFSAKTGDLKAGDTMLAYGLDNRSVERHRGDLWQSNFDANLQHIKNAPDLSMIRGLFKGAGTIAIVIGNGPSFHENLDQLKTLCKHRKPFIIACDRVFNKLCENGIRPHLTATLDGQAMVADFFNEDYICANDYFVANIVTHPDVIRKLSRGKIFWGGIAAPNRKTVDGHSEIISDLWNGFYAQIGNRFYNFLANYIIGDAVLRLACEMGCDGLVSLGNDLCFRGDKKITEEMKELCDEYPHDERIRNLPCQPIYLNDKFVSMYNKYHTIVKIGDENMDIVTTEPFMLASMAISRMHAIYPDTKLIDCSNAPIAGFHKCDFSEFVQPAIERPELFNDGINYRWAMQKKYKHMV